MVFDVLCAAMHGAVFGTFGEPVTLIREGQAPFTVRGIFMAEHESVDIQSGVPVSSTQPMVELQDSDLPNGVEEGDELRIRNCLYAVVDVRPDGNGVNKVFLHKAGHHEQP